LDTEKPQTGTNKISFHEEAERSARVGQLLIQSALANRDIQGYLNDPTPPRLWTVESVRRNPTCRVEWEHATVIGGIGVSLAAAKHKNWGQFLGISPLASNDPVHWCRILYVYRSTSPYNRRVEQRHALKRLLGKQHRKLVMQASRNTKQDFLDRYLTEAAAQVIKRRFGLDPGRFWRAAKGRELLDLPAAPRQLTLFDDPPNAHAP